MSTTHRRPSPGPGKSWAELLDRIAAEVEPTADGFALLGTPWSDDLPRDGWEERRREALTRVLYRRYYQRHDGQDAMTSLTQALPSARRAPAEEDSDWGAQLRRRLAVRQVWEDGWTEAGRTGDDVRVQRDGVAVLVRADEARRRDGDLRVLLPANRPLASPGFFITSGRDGSSRRAGAVIRMYLNLQPAHALDAFTDLVTRLDEAGIPFTANVVDHLDGFDRPDCTVVYGAREHLTFLVGAGVDVGRRHSGALGRRVPAFTLPVGPGLALAEDPQVGRRQGFGRHRCGLVATGVLQAAVPGTVVGRLTGIRGALAASGLDLTRLHLNPGSPDLDISYLLGGVA